MNKTELRLQIVELYSKPKLFITNYFEDLINELDIRTLKYEIDEETKKKKSKQ